MLAEPEPLAAIKETYRVLNTPLKDISIKQEIPPELTAALEQNTFYFSGFKTHHELVEASRLLKDTDGNFKPFNRYLKDIETIDKTYNKNYLRSEYNFATASTQMAVKWKEWEQDGDDYDLQYRTAGDDRVREEHAALDKTTLPPSDPFWDSYLPPNGWNCRCTTVQVRKGKYPQSNSDKAIAAGANCTAKPKQQIFRFNPGKQEKIFPPKHPYYKAPEEVKETVNEIADEETKIKKFIDEMPKNLTNEEKTAIAKNNLELEKAIKPKDIPMTVDQADKQSTNPNFGKEREYGINCQTCAPAYMLRLRGFDITAKPKTKGSKLEYLSNPRNTYKVWKNIDGTDAIQTTYKEWMTGKGYKKMTGKRYKEFFEENCKEEGVYEATILWKGDGGHATILQRFADGELRYIEPQRDNSKGSGREWDNLDFLCNEGKQTYSNGSHLGVMRIDNKIFNADYSDIFER